MSTIDDIYSEIYREHKAAENNSGANIPANGEIWIANETGDVLRRLEADFEKRAIEERITVTDFLFTKKQQRYFTETPLLERDGTAHVVLQAASDEVEDGDIVIMYKDGLRGRWR